MATEAEDAEAALEEDPAEALAADVVGAAEEVGLTPTQLASVPAKMTTGAVRHTCESSAEIIVRVCAHSQSSWLQRCRRSGG